MKHNHLTGRMISACVVLLALTVGARTSQAAYDVYLKIDGMKGAAKGFHKIVHLTNGIGDAGQLPVGTYSMQVEWVQHSKSSMDDWSQIQKMAVKGQGVPSNYTITMTTKPDNSVQATANSGVAGGQRMHQPITITKEVDASSPKIMNFSLAAGDVNGDGTVELRMAIKEQGMPKPSAPKN